MQRRGILVEGVKRHDPSRNPKGAPGNIGRRKPQPRHAGTAGHEAIQLPRAIEEASEQNQP